mmetsp:Transcript_25363/g.80259  ORF Transcript_25363/g.80259 Transcript_25363/m.80259 type:complete len:251 (+) Transcript_25363:1742-2494(+)
MGNEIDRFQLGTGGGLDLDGTTRGAGQGDDLGNGVARLARLAFSRALEVVRAAREEGPTRHTDFSAGIAVNFHIKVRDVVGMGRGDRPLEIELAKAPRDGPALHVQIQLGDEPRRHGHSRDHHGHDGIGGDDDALRSGHGLAGTDDGVLRGGHLNVVLASLHELRRDSDNTLGLGRIAEKRGADRLGHRGKKLRGPPLVQESVGLALRVHGIVGVNTHRRDGERLVLLVSHDAAAHDSHLDGGEGRSDLH